MYEDEFLQSSSPSPAICTVHHISMIAGSLTEAYDRGSSVSPHLAAESCSGALCSCSVLRLSSTSFELGTTSDLPRCSNRTRLRLSSATEVTSVRHLTAGPYLSAI